ncbi:polysaccharide deacetylase family protein [Litorimonas sp. RW-G-Af-16]|uniref:polysaccharide deacetylase family protein n=1 Tax=Litorimonas sp. RW-G-Af-16 TaxID=3241168 RepID=UPI00390CBC47
MTPHIETLDIDKSKSGKVDAVRRRLARHRHKRIVTPKLDRPIISFTFDDCPKSVVETALPLIEAEGWRATIYVACGLCDITNHMGLHMSRDDIKAVARNGHEIGDHTYGHLDGLRVTPDMFMADIVRNQAELDALGIAPSRTFAYPYGQVTTALKKRLLKRFDLSRGVNRSSSTAFDEGLSPAMRLYHGQAVNEARTRIESYSTAPQWEVLFTHDVRDTPSDYGCTAADLKRTIQTVKESGAIVLPVAQALDIARRQT